MSSATAPSFSWPRVQALLATLWGGLLVGVGGIAAPSLFLVFDKAQAGLAAGRIFSVEARVSLVLAIVLFVLERRRVRDLVEQGAATSVMSAPLLMVLGALFLTVFGHFALQPMMEAAKAGQATALSFGAAHGLSAALFWLKAVLVLAMGWRLGGLR